MDGVLWRACVPLAASILCWSPCAANPPGCGEFGRLWDELASGDPAAAQRAAAALAARPREAVPFLRGRLRPSLRLDPRRVARLVEDLDGDRYEARERATRELGRLGEAVEPALRGALATGPSPEARRRIGRLLERFTQERLRPPPGRVRQARAVEVLEQVGDGPARRLLAELAGGEPAAPLTVDARGALQRLAAEDAGER